MSPGGPVTTATKTRAWWLARRRVERGRLHASGQVEVGSEVLDTLVGEVVVQILPREGLTHIFARLERFHRLHYVKIGNVNLHVLLQHRILLDDAYAVFEELRVNRNAVLLWHQHLGSFEETVASLFEGRVSTKSMGFAKNEMERSWGTGRES